MCLKAKLDKTEQVEATMYFFYAHLQICIMQSDNLGIKEPSPVTEVETRGTILTYFSCIRMS